jgi:hypothetical protein
MFCMSIGKSVFGVIEHCSTEGDLPKIIDTLIDNRKIKDRLLSNHPKEELVITTSE